MTSVAPVLAEHRAAAERFIAAASRVAADRWGVPVAPGKWTPGQICEHVTLGYEEGASLLRGEPRAPTVPRWVRPILRALLLPRVLRGWFPPGAKSPAPLRPSASPLPPAPAFARLRDAATRLEQEVRALIARGRTTMEDPAFGRMRLEDAVRLGAQHTLHHLRQLPGGTVT